MTLVFDNHINFFFYQKAPIPFLESSGYCILKIFHVGSLLRLWGAAYLCQMIEYSVLLIQCTFVPSCSPLVIYVISLREKKWSKV